ncbi:AAA family ATPase [Paenibacillus aceti]|uniref:ATPase n=1 Tax=Paenibacillus aceti TaxID=1820010 RepID=A0ABQ1VY00_9BACL|nr:AAA family ATPase [Paenibacillus aceti]GGG03093.1 ATPase [Paenibacillus aceti]
MQFDGQQFYVVTGGPGSGKSTLLDYLEQQGFMRSIEAGRSIIQEQTMIGGAALPWEDRILFAELMLSWEMRSYRQGLEQGNRAPVLFDRGVPDIIGYLRLEGLDVPIHIQRAGELFRYNKRVFIAPPWPDIYRQDAERKQDLETAHRTFDMMVDVYTELGYELVELPRCSIEERAEYIRSTIFTEYTQNSGSSIYY